MKRIVISLIFLLIGNMVFADIYSLYGMNNGRYSEFLGKFGFRGSNFTTEVSDYSSDSIFNQYGAYGSEYRNSIWNQYREYGSPYRQASCTNEFAREAPAIVDRNNNIVGYLTANVYHPGQTDLGRRISRALRLQ